MVGNFGEVYLLDWGLAKVLGRNLNMLDESNTDAGSNEQQASSDDTITIPMTLITGSESTPEAQDNNPVQMSEQQTILVDSDDDEYAGDDTVGVVFPYVNSNPSSIEMPVAAWDDVDFKRILGDPMGTESGKKGKNDHVIQSTTRRIITRKRRSIPNSDNDKTLHDSSQSLLGQVMGTPKYMSPEQAQGLNDRHDQRTDIYSLGVMLWDIVVGEPMRPGNVLKEILQKAHEGYRPNLQQIAQLRRIEPDLMACILKATDPDIHKRHQTADEIAADLQNWLDGSRRWTKIIDLEFSNFPDLDLEPAGTKHLHAIIDREESVRSEFLVHTGRWGIRNGYLSLLSERPSIIHLNRNIVGDVRMEVIASVKAGEEGEISPILMAPITPRRKARDDGYCFQFGADSMTHNKIARNGQDIAYGSYPVLKPGKKYRVLAEVLEGMLRIEVDGEEILKQRDFFPLTGSRIGIYCYEIGLQVERIQAWAAGVPQQRTCLAIPDALAACEKPQEAAREYDRIIHSHPGSAEADEAAFKAGLCLLTIADTAENSTDRESLFQEARDYFQGLLETPLSALGCIGLTQLAERSNLPIPDQINWLIQGLQFNSEYTQEGASDLYVRIIIKADECREKGYLKESFLLWKMLSDSKNVPRFLQARALLEAAVARLWPYRRYRPYGLHRIR